MGISRFRPNCIVGCLCYELVEERLVSPVGWYVGSYLLRFVELAQEGNDDPEKRFLTWENTILVRATDLDEAYDKIVECARLSTNPYKGGPQAVDVQWVFEGVTEILPVYEEIADGCEIIWSECTKKLKNIRKCVRAKGEFHTVFYFRE